MRVIVTGAAGFVGSNVALTLEAQGHEVIAVDNLSVGVRDNLKALKGPFVQADIRGLDWGQWGSVQAVIHEAAITDTTVMDEDLMLGVNTVAFERLLQWAAASGAKVVYASSAATYGQRKPPMREEDAPTPANIYGVSKARMDELTARYLHEHPRMHIVGLRYFNVFGPGETHKAKAASMIWQLALQMREGRRPRVFKHGEQYRDFVYVKDVARATISALASKSCGVVNVGTGVPSTFNQIIEALNRAMGLALPPEYFDNPYAFYQSETLADVSRAKAWLGYAPAYTLEAAVRDYMETAGFASKA